MTVIGRRTRRVLTVTRSWPSGVGDGLAAGVEVFGCCGCWARTKAMGNSSIPAIRKYVILFITGFRTEAATCRREFDAAARKVSCPSHHGLEFKVCRFWPPGQNRSRSNRLSYGSRWRRRLFPTRGKCRDDVPVVRPVRRRGSQSRALRENHRTYKPFVNDGRLRPPIPELPRPAAGFLRASAEAPLHGTAHTRVQPNRASILLLRGELALQISTARRRFPPAPAYNGWVVSQF